MSETKSTVENILLIKKAINKKRFSKSSHSDLERLRIKEIALWGSLVLPSVLLWICAVLLTVYKFSAIAIAVVFAVYLSVAFLTLFHIMRISRILAIFHMTTIETYEGVLLH